MGIVARYIFETLGLTGSTVTGRLELGVDIIGARLNERLNAIHELRLEVDRTSPKWSKLGLGKRIRVTDTYPVVPTTQTFRVIDLDDEEQDGEEFRANLVAESIAADLIRHTVRERRDRAGEDATTLLSNVITQSKATGSFSVGTVPTSPLLALSVNYDNLLATVEAIAALQNTDWRVNENGSIDLGAIGSARSNQLRFRHNVKGIKRKISAREPFANRVFPTGGGEPPLTAADMEHAVTVVTDAKNIGVAEDTLVPSDASYALDDYMAVRIVKGPGLGNVARIKTTAVATDAEPYDHLLLWADLTGVTTSSVIKLFDDTAAQKFIEFREDKASIDAFGLVEGKYENQEFTRIVNLVTEPLLSGTYTSGLCAGWAKEGAPTVTENTDTGFIKLGTKSQKVVAGSAGLGVKQTGITVTVAKPYVIMIWVYVVSGAIRLEFDPDSTSGDGWIPPTGFEAIVSETGVFRMIALQLGRAIDYPTATGAGIRIISHGAAATFYLDSAQVVAGVTIPPKIVSPDDVTPFYKEFWAASSPNFEPPISYEVDATVDEDRARVGSELALGDVFAVINEDLAINTSVRLIGRERDLIELGKPISLELANIPETFARRWARTAEFMERLAAMQRMQGITGQRSAAAKGGALTVTTFDENGAPLDTSSVLDGIRIRGKVQNVGGTAYFDVDNAIIQLDPGGTNTRVWLGPDIGDKADPDTGMANVLVGKWPQQTLSAGVTVPAGTGILCIHSDGSYSVLGPAGLTYGKSTGTIGNYPREVWSGLVEDGETFLASLVVPTGRKVIFTGQVISTWSKHRITSLSASFRNFGAYTHDVGGAGGSEILTLALYQAATEGSGDPGSIPTSLFNTSLPAGTYTDLRPLWWMNDTVASFTTELNFYKGMLFLYEVPA